jgi:precorrin-2 dehydrogenase/sirohydrochlorin ferrochelatase
MGYMVNLSLEGREALVVGGGEIAARKVEDLLAAKAHVTVVAPRICARMEAMEERITVHRRPYQTADIGNAFVAIAATDDEELNAQVSRDCAARSVLVNVVDRPALCTFTVPAVVRRGHLTIAIATDGLSPAFSGVLREELEGRYGPEYGELVERLGELRQKMIGAGWRGAAIRDRLGALYRAGIVEAIAAGDDRRVEELLSLPGGV